MSRTHLTQEDFADGDVPVAPRIRVNKTTPLTLSTTWQRVDYNGTSAANFNNYPKSDNGSNNMIYYDTAAKLFRFMSPVDCNYTLSLYMKTTATSLLGALGFNSMTSMQLRFVVPKGNADGSDYYFPFPGEDGLIDLMPVNAISPWRQEYFTTIFADERKRVNGVGIEVRLSQNTGGTVTLVSTNALIYGR